MYLLVLSQLHVDGGLHVWDPIGGVSWCCCHAIRLAVVCAWSRTRGALSPLLLSLILTGLSYHHPLSLWDAGGYSDSGSELVLGPKSLQIKARAAYDGTIKDYQSIHVTQSSSSSVALNYK